MIRAQTTTDDPRRRETDALIEAIWGPRPTDLPQPIDPALRARQNRALATALRAYLQQYLTDTEDDG